MPILEWDALGSRRYETGVDHGVLYIPNDMGVYDEGYAWNGLTTVTESPSGAEANPQYADNIKYLNLYSTEQFAGTIEAFTYPDAFAQCNGSVSPQPGVAVGQQARKAFGFAYRTKLGNDVLATAFGFKIHLVYGATAAPSEQAHATINDSPEALALSWEISTTPISVSGLDPTSTITIDSTLVDPDNLQVLMDALYGTGGTDPYLPLPDEVIAMFDGALTAVRMVGANAPAYNSGTHVVTLPSVTGVQWKINGVNKTSGAQPALSTGQTAVVTAHPLAGYNVTGDDDWTYDY